MGKQDMKKIGVVGTGIMGAGIAANYLKAGHEVFVWNRNPNKLKPLIDGGAVAVATPKEVAKKAEMVFEVTATDESSRAAWLGADGILEGALPTTILISCGTLSVEWVEELAGVTREKAITYFDMPLTGSRAGAESGALVMLVGGDEGRLNEIRHELEPISQEVIYFGSAGAGTRYKLLLNALQAIHVLALGEVLKIAKEKGMDVAKVGSALAERPGGTATKLAWRDYQKAPERVNFSIQWIAKDLAYAKKFANGEQTPLLDDALAKLEEAIAKGLGEEDWTRANKL